MGARWQSTGMEVALPPHSTWTDRLCNNKNSNSESITAASPKVKREFIILEKLLPPGEFVKVNIMLCLSLWSPGMVSIATVEYVQGAVIICSLPSKSLVAENALLWGNTPSNIPCSTSSSSWHCTPRHPLHIWTFGFYTWKRIKSLGQCLNISCKKMGVKSLLCKSLQGPFLLG